MRTQRSREYDHLEFLLEKFPRIYPAILAMQSMTLAPTEASGLQEVPLPKNPMRRGRMRFQARSPKCEPTPSRNKGKQTAAKLNQKIAEADATGIVTLMPGGQLGIAADEKWYAYMYGRLDKIIELLAALNKTFPYELSDLDPVEPLKVLAKDDTQRERQRPPEDIPGTVEQLTDTVVIAPGAPARA